MNRLTFRLSVYSPKFWFEHLQMTMKLHGQSAFSLVTLDAHHLQKNAYLECLFCEGYKGLYFFKHRIVKGQMIVRAQCWIVMPLDKRAYVHDQFQLPGHVYSTGACAHLGLRWKQGN